MSRAVLLIAVVVFALAWSAFTQAEPVGAPVAPPAPAKAPPPSLPGPGDKSPLPRVEPPVPTAAGRKVRLDGYDEPTPQSLKWEYRVLDRGAIDNLSGAANTDFVGQHLEAGLNRLGAEGWELVAIEPNIGALSLSRYIFKRRAPYDSPPPPVQND